MLTDKDLKTLKILYFNDHNSSGIFHPFDLTRFIRKFSQEDLEEKSSVSRRTISEIERGNADIRYTNLYQIAEAFGLKISELLDFKL